MFPARGPWDPSSQITMTWALVEPNNRRHHDAKQNKWRKSTQMWNISKFPRKGQSQPEIVLQVHSEMTETPKCPLRVYKKKKNIIETVNSGMWVNTSKRFQGISVPGEHTVLLCSKSSPKEEQTSPHTSRSLNTKNSNFFEGKSPLTVSVTNNSCPKT